MAKHSRNASEQMAMSVHIAPSQTANNQGAIGSHSIGPGEDIRDHLMPEPKKGGASTASRKPIQTAQPLFGAGGGLKVNMG